MARKKRSRRRGKSVGLIRLGGALAAAFRVFEKPMDELRGNKPDYGRFAEDLRDNLTDIEVIKEVGMLVGLPLLGAKAVGRMNPGVKVGSTTIRLV